MIPNWEKTADYYFEKNRKDEFAENLMLLVISTGFLFIIDLWFFLFIIKP